MSGEVTNGALPARGASRRASYTGLLVFLASTSMIFAAFTSAFVLRRSLSHDWVKLPLPHIIRLSTALLVGSSVVLEIARRRLRTGARIEFNWWWAAGTALGLAFLGGQTLAWREWAAAGIYLTTNPSASFFYVLTAAHGAHVIGGLSALAYVAIQAFRYRLGPAKRTAVDLATVFWHFLDGLWLYILGLLVIWG